MIEGNASTCPETTIIQKRNGAIFTKAFPQLKKD